MRIAATARVHLVSLVALTRCLWQVRAGIGRPSSVALDAKGLGQDSLHVRNMKPRQLLQSFAFHVVFAEGVDDRDGGLLQPPGC